MKNKLIEYCKKHQVDPEEGIRIIHTFLNRKGFTKSHWKEAQFGFYVDARIQSNDDTTIALVKEIVQMPEYQAAFETFYPYKTLDKTRQTINLCRQLADRRKNRSLKRIFKEKGFNLIERYMGQEKISRGVKPTIKVQRINV